MSEMDEAVRDRRCEPADEPESESGCESESERIRPWSRDEVRALRARSPAVSLWRAVAAQAAVGLALAGLFWLAASARGVLALSALYGAACVTVPAAAFAWGMWRQAAVSNANGALAGLMLWEFVKISVALAMMVSAVKVVPGLSWPAFLAAIVVGIKVNWLALLWQGRMKKNVASDKR